MQTLREFRDWFVEECTGKSFQQVEHLVRRKLGELFPVDAPAASPVSKGGLFGKRKGKAEDDKLETDDGDF